MRLRWPRERAARDAAIMNRKVRRLVWLGFERGKGEALGTRLVCEVASHVRSVEEEDSVRNKSNLVMHKLIPTTRHVSHIYESKLALRFEPSSQNLVLATEMI